MYSLIRTAVATATLALCIPFASATVLTFDDIVGPDEFAYVPGNYGGLDWSGSGWAVFTFDDPIYAAHSGNGRVTTDFGSTDSASIIRFLTPMVFEGAWFAGYESSFAGDPITVRFDMFFNNLLVASSSTLTMSDTPAFLAAGWGNVIDAVAVSSSDHGFYVMDDFSFAAAAAVPEPATLALVLAGLGVGMATSASRRRRSRLAEV